MAGKLLTVRVVDEGGGNKPHTAVQISPSDNVPVDLFGIELIPLGSSGPSVPLEFDLCKQTGTGVSSDGIGTVQGLSPLTR